MQWISEGDIPDGEKLYRYVKPWAFPEGQNEIPYKIFTDPDLSCDWKKYQRSPEASRHITEGKTVIISITVCDEIRNPRNPKNYGKKETVWIQEIIHAPDKNDNNFSHSLIKGKKGKAVQMAIQEASTIHNPNTKI